jgi:uncharacterized SAM-binding protein YcdF (DUF218 family)
MKFMRKYRIPLVILVLLLTLYFARVPILRSLYGFLNVSREPERVYDYGLVLGGDALDRPAAAAEWYHKGKIKKIICTGGQVPGPLAAMNIMLTEAETAFNRLLTLGVPEEDIIVIREATSTREEADAVNQYIASAGGNSLLIITTQTHSRRARAVFREYANHVEIIDAWGVSPRRFDARYWWKSEHGLLAVFEEYVKTVYYWIAY